MNGKNAYTVILSEEVDIFLDTLPVKAKNKILYNIRLVEGGRMDSEIFKKLEGHEIWEFRTLFAGVKYRLLSFFDKDNRALVIATHGFIKKTRKTPEKEIERAKTIKTEYFNRKQQKS